VEYQTELMIGDAWVAEAIVEYEWDDVLTGDRATGRVADVSRVLIRSGKTTIDITAAMDEDAIRLLAACIEASDEPDTATRNRWRNNRSAALYGVP